MAQLTITIAEDVIVIVSVGDPTAEEWAQCCAEVLDEYVTIEDYRTDGVRHAWRVVREKATTSL